MFKAPRAMKGNTKAKIENILYQMLRKNSDFITTDPKSLTLTGKYILDEGWAAFNFLSFKHHNRRNRNDALFENEWIIAL